MSHMFIPPHSIHRKLSKMIVKKKVIVIQDRKIGKRIYIKK